MIVYPYRPSRLWSWITGVVVVIVGLYVWGYWR